MGLDPSAGQLGIARRMQDEYGLRFPLIRASGEQVPLGAGTVDMVISEYGAAIWADPHFWIPEAARLLRPGGQILFLGNSSLLMLCVPEQGDLAATERLLRPYFDMHRFEWPGEPTTDFHLGQFPFVDAEWAARWPCEEVWRARKYGGSP